MAIPATNAWFGPGFTDGRKLATRVNVDWVCVHCDALKQAGILRKLQIAVLITPDGVYSIAKGEQKRRFLLNPPKPPFLLLIQKTTNAQHLVWGTPISRSAELIYMRYGVDAIYPIRMPVLRQAHQAALRLLEAMSNPSDASARPSKSSRASKPAKTRPVFPSSLWQASYIDIGEPGHGELSKRALDTKMTADLGMLACLNAGEIWSLGTLLRDPDPNSPTSPAPILFNPDLIKS